MLKICKSSTEVDYFVPFDFISMLFISGTLTRVKKFEP